MTDHLRKICIPLFSGFIALLLLPQLAVACSCDLPPFGKTEKQLVELARERSQSVFAGEVTEIILRETIPGEPAPVAEVRFKVLRSWKGATDSTAAVFTANTCCICGYTFAVGERYLVFTYGSNENEKLWTNICTRTKLLSEAKKDLQVLGKPYVSNK